MWPIVWLVMWCLARLQRASKNSRILSDAPLTFLALGYLMIDPTTSWLTFALLGLSFVYIVSPLDILPDVVPVVGLLDDAALLYILLWWLQASIKDRHWQQARAKLAQFRA